MVKAFLTAEWKNLLMANYLIDPKLLQAYLPYRTELDPFNGDYYVSLVGFLFSNTKVKGIRFPFHHTFEEVNLRFYVRYKEKDGWKRGVVFLKEIVPKRAITFIANTVYGEKYATHAMKHSWLEKEETIYVEYRWKVGAAWNFVSATAHKEKKEIVTGSVEQFITEHYWGYTQINNTSTGVYEVAHPQWRVHPVSSFAVECHFEKLYGQPFGFLQNQKPQNVLLAEGSAINVLPGAKLL